MLSKSEKRAVFVLVVLSFALLRASVSADTVGTSLSISLQNIPPSLIGQIPNQTWATHTNLTEAFDLDDYFIDNETLIYNYTVPQNITVLVNESTNKVSFYPQYSFEGIRTIVFTAYDLFGASASSNAVTLNVTTDTTPPTWSSPSKDKSEVVQNAVVTFSTNWEDNIALKRFVFAIKQENGWLNLSSTSFSGRTNTSSYTIQISAPQGTVVSWRFYAYDTSDNENATAIQNFTVSAVQTSPPATDSQSDFDEEVGVSPPGRSPEALNRNYRIDSPESYHVEVKYGARKTITIKITNIGGTDLPFEIDITGLTGITTTISDRLFNLSVGKSKTISIDFDVDRYTRPDTYYGKILINSHELRKEIPIVIIVLPYEISYDLTVMVLPEYKITPPDSIIKMNISLQNLKEIESSNFSLNYYITDYEGTIYDSKFEEMVLQSRSATVTKELRIPLYAQRGEYLVIARAVSGDEVLIKSDSFEVGDRFNLKSFLSKYAILILALAIVLFSIIVVIKHYKNKERIRLLNLYLLITQIDGLLKKGKFDAAIDLYLKIKTLYGEKISDTSTLNKETLRTEVEKLTAQITASSLFSPPQGEKKESTGVKAEEKSPPATTSQEALPGQDQKVEPLLPPQEKKETPISAQVLEKKDPVPAQEKTSPPIPAPQVKVDKPTRAKKVGKKKNEKKK